MVIYFAGQNRRGRRAVLAPPTHDTEINVARHALHTRAKKYSAPRKCAPKLGQK